MENRDKENNQIAVLVVSAMAFEIVTVLRIYGFVDNGLESLKQWKSFSIFCILWQSNLLQFQVM